MSRKRDTEIEGDEIIGNINDEHLFSVIIGTTIKKKFNKNVKKNLVFERLIRLLLRITNRVVMICQFILSPCGYACLYMFDVIIA